MQLTNQQKPLEGLITVIDSIATEPEIKPTPTAITVSGPQTTLEGSLANIPWQDGFTFGVGVDAITGSVLGSALTPFTPNPNPVKTSHESYRFIESDSQLNLEIGATASGAYNIEGLKISASTEFLTQIQYSETSITLIAEYSSLFSYSDQAVNYELTDKAKQLISSPEQFRQSYGDYFVADSQRGSRFIAVYVCQAKTAKNLVQFKANLGAEVPEVFSAEGSAKFMQEASKENINISLQLYFEGVPKTVPSPSGPWNPETILEALKWFKANETGQNMKAELKHYSTIDPTYPRTISVAPNVFVELSQLYVQLWDIRIRYDSLPRHYQNQFKLPYNTLNLGIVANQDNLAQNATLRQDYQQQADNLNADLEDVSARMDFYHELQAYLQTNPEPAKGQKIIETRGTKIWIYGFDRYLKSDAVTIHSFIRHYKAGAKAGGLRQHTFEFGPDSRYLIVGWKVISNYTDGLNGSWRKNLSQILLTDHASVEVESRHGRNTNWSFEVYYVEAKDYQFSATI